LAIDQKELQLNVKQRAYRHLFWNFERSNRNEYFEFTRHYSIG